MFVGNMVTEAIPARVYSLYKIVVSKKEITRAEVQKCIEPEGIYEGNSYFAAIFKAATELGLVEIQDNIVIPLIPKEEIKGIEDFKKYVISKMDSFEGEQFYEVTNIIVNLNEEIYKYRSVADTDLLNLLSNQIGKQITAPMARGWRFWAPFIGLGYVNGMAFLPNAYIYVKNILKILNIEKNKEIAIDEFMAMLGKYGKMLTSNMQPERNMNLALSSALRELHDNGEIELKYSSDAENRWILFPSNEAFNDQIASIIVKGVK